MKITSTFKSRLTILFLQHAQASIASFGRLCRTPVASLLTVTAIAITLALPTTFLTLLNNTQQLSSTWKTGASLSLFLTKKTTEQQAQALLEHLSKQFKLKEIHYIPPQQGLDLLAQQSGVSMLLTGLPDNPLPGVITVKPKHTSLSQHAMKQLITALQAVEHIDSVQVDLAWLERLHAILALVKRLVLALTVLLALAVFFIVANTLRLTLQHTRREIEIFELIGATHAFIRRPLLYIGFWYGLGGGLLAWLIVNTLILSLQTSTQRIASVYHGHLHLNYVGFKPGLWLCAITVLLGLSAAWGMVKYYTQQHKDSRSRLETSTFG